MGGAENKAAEQLPHIGGGAVHAFGMPLYADGEGMGRQFDGLHGLVGGDGGDRQVFPDPV